MQLTSYTPHMIGNSAFAISATINISIGNLTLGNLRAENYTKQNFAAQNIAPFKYLSILPTIILKTEYKMIRRAKVILLSLQRVEIFLCGKELAKNYDILYRIYVVLWKISYFCLLVLWKRSYFCPLRKYSHDQNYWHPPPQFYQIIFYLQFIR